MVGALMVAAAVLLTLIGLGAVSGLMRIEALAQEALRTALHARDKANLALEKLDVDVNLIASAQQAGRPYRTLAMLSEIPPPPYFNSNTSTTGGCPLPPSTVMIICTAALRAIVSGDGKDPVPGHLLNIAGQALLAAEQAAGADPLTAQEQRYVCALRAIAAGRGLHSYPPIDHLISIAEEALDED
jgi:hypothetical protein